MTMPKEKAEIRQRLLHLRRGLTKVRAGEHQGEERLRDRALETEEAGQEEHLSRGTEQLDTMAVERVDALDRALRKLESGSYDVCDACGGTIPLGELEAVPWRTTCLACERGREQETSPEGPAEAQGEPSASPPLPQRFQGMTDGEIARAVGEDLRNDGRVEMEDLAISCHRGAVRLEGSLPSRQKHGILLDFVQNTLGLKEIEDRVRIDRLAWERPDPAAPPREGGQEAGIPYEELEELAEGSQEGKSAFHSLKSGKPVAPADEFVTEEES